MVTSLARRHVHSECMKILARKGELYRINCDSVLFTLPEEQQLQMKISSTLPGAFKHEMTDIKSVAQVGTFSQFWTFTSLFNALLFIIGKH